MRIKLGHKVYEWSMATLIMRMMAWGLLKRQYVQVKMMLAVHEQMAKYANAQETKGNKVDASMIKKEAIKKLGNSGMELLKKLDIDESELYRLAERARR